MYQSSLAQTAQEGDVEPLRKPVAVQEIQASGGVTGAISGWPMWLGLGSREAEALSVLAPLLSLLSPWQSLVGSGLNQRLGSWGWAPTVDGYKDRLCLLGKG